MPWKTGPAGQLSILQVRKPCTCIRTPVEFKYASSPPHRRSDPISLSDIDELTKSKAFTSPILAMAFHPQHPCVLALAQMDGGISICSIPSLSALEDLYTCAHFPAMHRKYAVEVRWNPGGSLLASGGYDGKIAIYTCLNHPSSASASPVQVSIRGTVNISNPVESLEFAHSHVLIAARNKCKIYSVEIPDDPRGASADNVQAQLAFRSQSLNLPQASERYRMLSFLQPNGRDTGEVGMPEEEEGVIPFYPTDLRLSPSGKYLLVATSSSSGRILLCRVLCREPSTQSGHNEIFSGGHSKLLWSACRHVDQDADLLGGTL